MCSGEIKCMMESEGKILLLLTGGTICSFGDEQGNRRDVDIQKAKALLLQYRIRPALIRNLKLLPF